MVEMTIFYLKNSWSGRQDLNLQDQRLRVPNATRYQVTDYAPKWSSAQVMLLLDEMLCRHRGYLTPSLNIKWRDRWESHPLRPA